MKRAKKRRHQKKEKKGGRESAEMRTTETGTIEEDENENLK